MKKRLIRWFWIFITPYLDAILTWAVEKLIVPILEAFLDAFFRSIKKR